MGNLWLRLEVLAGSDIYRTVCEGVDLAGRIKIGVEFKFNDVLVMCREGDNPHRIVLAWEEARESDNKYKYAQDRGK